MAYDQANRLITYGTSATYAYNGDGLRMSKTMSGTTSQFLWDVAPALPLLLIDGSTAYLYGPGGLPLEQVNGSTVLWLHHDQLGSTRLVTDSTGLGQATYTYDADGNLTTGTGAITNPIRFAGAYRDGESGLYYLRARYFDPGTGQFISRDPVVGVTGQPYDYAKDDPLNAVDPTGLICWQFWDPNQCDNPVLEYGTHGSTSFGVSASADAGTPVAHGTQGVDLLGAGGSVSTDSWLQVKDPTNTVHKTSTMGGFVGKKNGWAIGVQCSAGVHASMSNAADMSKIYGKFHNFNLNLFVVSTTYSWSDNGTWVFSPQVGPGIGASASSYDTDTQPG